MDSVLGLVSVVIVAAMLIGSVLGWVTLAQLQALKKQLVKLEEKLTRFETQLNALASSAPQQSPSPPKSPPAPVTPPPVTDSQQTVQPIQPLPKAGISQVKPSGDRARPPQQARQAAEWLTAAKNNWMVWLGGACVGLSGIFLVKYSIDKGLLGPSARIALALITGLIFHAGAIWLRRKFGQYSDTFAALAGGASIMLYAAMLAALHLYGLWSPGWTFALLLLVSAATMLLALLHGPVLAGIGILGAYLVPILVDTGSNNITGALIYSAIVTVSGLWLIRYVFRTWLWLGTIAGALGWWLLGLIQGAEVTTLVIYLLAVAYLIVAIQRLDWLLDQALKIDTTLPWRQVFGARENSTDQRILLALFAILGLHALCLTDTTFSATLVFDLLLIPLLLFRVIQHKPFYSPLAWFGFVAGVTGVLIAGLTLHGFPQAGAVEGEAGDHLLLTLFVMSALYCAASLWLAQTSPFATSLYALAFLSPVLLLTLGYILVTDLRTQWQWALPALGLGAGYAHLLYRSRKKEASPALISVLVICAHLAYSLAVVMLVRDASLTLALAAQVLTLTWLDRKYKLKALSIAVKVVLTLVIVRLTLNPWLLTYPAETHWSLWTCGGSFLLTLVASRLADQRENLQPWLQGATLHLLALTLLMETRYQLYDGQVFINEYSFIEAAIHTATWGSLALVYKLRARLGSTLSSFYGLCSEILILLAACNYGFSLLFTHNPLWSDSSVATTPLFNVLLLAYGLPVLIAAAWYWLVGRSENDDREKKIAGSAMAFCLWYFVTIEIRHLWHGELDIHQAIGNGESYSYSMVWLLLAIAGTSLGIRLQRNLMYRGAMLLLLVVIAKIFLFDMSELKGLWRAASFMGLGISLLGLAWFHQWCHSRHTSKRNLQENPT